MGHYSSADDWEAIGAAATTQTGAGAVVPGKWHINLQINYVIHREILTLLMSNLEITFRHSKVPK